ncbi:MAG: outer membrane beta-barrel protein [Paludibacter sp.]|nr:outer membrane beta-barrel protein [Paludibacter sp.]
MDFLEIMILSRTITFLILFFIFCIVTTGQSQESSSYQKLTGKVVTTDNNQLVSLPFASIRLLSAKDSSYLTGTTTNNNGQFELRVENGKEQLLLVSCIGYEALYQPFILTNNTLSYTLKDIVLSGKSVKLSEAVVVGQRSEMVVKTDTVEYNASAYKLQQNAVVEDLLKKLPGITITDEGKILVNGKEVKRVMVDGKDFFRSNPNLSIKNIPASIMEKLQVIDDKSELSKLTGVDDGEENIAINITIQKDKKRGWLVSNNLGGGQELNGSEGNLMRYTVNSFAARLVGETQLGVVANGNNINGMTVGGGGSTMGSGKPGLNSSLSVGINFSSGKDDNKTPWIINSDVSYGFNERILRRTSIRQYFLQDSTSYQTDTANQVTRESGLRFSAKLENHSVTGWVFSFSPSGSVTTNYQNNSGYTLLQAGNAARDSVNSNRYNRISNTPGINIGGVMTISHDFEKKRRKLSLSIDSRYTNSDGSGETTARYYYYRNKEGSRLVNRNQQWENASANFNNRMYLSYIEPIGEKQSLQFVYWIRSSTNDNIINNYKPDPLTGAYTVLDLPYSRSLNNVSLTQQVGASYRGVIKKVIYTVGIDYNPSFIRSLSYIQNGSVLGADSTITYFPGLQTFNYAPNAYLMYNIGKGKSIRFDYRGRSEAPSVYQLDPSRNETNPTNIRIGNPNLSPKFTHWSRLRYSSNQREKQQSLLVMFEGNYILDDIINFTNYDGTTGIKTTTPINQSGSWNATGMLMYNQPLSSNFQINNYTQAGVRNNIGFSSVNSSSSSQKNIANTTTVNEELGLSYKWEWLYLMTKATYQLNSTTYSVENMLPKNNTSLGGFITAQATLPSSWTFSSVLNYRSLTGFSSEYSRSELLWNVEISKSMLRNKAATVTLLLNDILQQQLSVSQVVSSNYVEDQQFNTLKSFVMLAFSYRFNTMGGK